MTTRIRSLLTGAATAVLAVTAAVLLVSPASAAPEGKPMPTPANGATDSTVAPMHCSGHPHTDKDSRTGRFFDANFVNIRRFPHTSCTSDGQGQLTHNANYHCWAPGDTVTRGNETWSTWTYLVDTTSNPDVAGWVSDAFLDRNPDGASRGSLERC